MLFNSPAFAVFLPVVFLLHWWWFRKGRNSQNLLLLISSYIFYGFWDWRFLSLMFISSLTDFVVGILIGDAEDDRRRKLLLGISLTVNLGILGFFKYFNFFTDAFIRLLNGLGMEADPFTVNVILPVGISFYTFQTLSYTIDIYRGKMKPVRDPLAFFTFVSFFPQLMAGPIERAERLLPQFLKKRDFDFSKAASGLQLLLYGMFKKVVIADRLAPFVEQVFNMPEEAKGATVVLAACMFSIQIYCDFSGYSDMAIGLARFFGIDLMTNFRTPFFSRSVREFWSRWHISLSTWFRDYVYFPLGGSRSGTGRWVINIMLTYSISGLWHGANYTFVIWGSMYGLIYCLEMLPERFGRKPFRLPAVSGALYVFLVFAFLMIFFRADKLGDAVLLIRNLAIWDAAMPDLSMLAASSREGVLLAFAFGVFVCLELASRKENITQVFARLPGPFRWGMYYLLVFLFIMLADLSVSREFVYFQF
jgi:D-alanyl-lipoteichoic acid acyltransferase DltB (MBOAT superfamily)